MALCSLRVREVPGSIPGIPLCSITTHWALRWSKVLVRTDLTQLWKYITLPYSLFRSVMFLLCEQNLHAFGISCNMEYGTKRFPKVENPSIDLGASRMRSGRSANELIPPFGISTLDMDIYKDHDSATKSQVAGAQRRCIQNLLQMQANIL